jgi:serine protease
VVESDAGPLGFAGESLPALTVPDNSPAGIDTLITADRDELEVTTVEVHLEIAHTWRGDLILTLISPTGESAPVVEILPDDSGDDVRGTFVVTGFTTGSSGTGDWTLRLTDRGPGDIGLLEYWSIGINQPAP